MPQRKDGRWSVLERYGVEDVQELVDYFLPKLRGLTIEQQLAKQGVQWLCRRPLLVSGLITYIEGRGLVLFLHNLAPEKIEFGDDELDYYIAEDVDTLGHEIGHLFEWGVSPSGDRVIHSWPHKTQLSWDRIEDFCEAFGQRWAKIPEHKRMAEEFLLKHFSYPTAAEDKRRHVWIPVNP